MELRKELAAAKGEEPIEKEEVRSIPGMNNIELNLLPRLRGWRSNFVGYALNLETLYL